MQSKGKILIGITGGIGAGKSIASNYFEAAGYTVIYADEIAKRLYRTNSLLKQKLVDEFGKGILDKDGNIAGIGARHIILSNRRNVKRVNKIVHPFVRKEINDILKGIDDKIVFIEAAIMFDTGFYKSMNHTVLVYSPKELRIKRAGKRDKIPKSEVNRLINLQLDERKKLKLADFVIRNDSTKAKMLKALNNFEKMMISFREQL